MNYISCAPIVTESGQVNCKFFLSLINELISEIRYDLDSNAMELLRIRLENLEFEGYKWSHPFTQCVMQTVMLNIRFKYVVKIEFSSMHFFTQLFFLDQKTALV